MPMFTYRKGQKQRCRACNKILSSPRYRFCSQRCQEKVVRVQSYPSQELYKKHEYQEVCS